MRKILSIILSLVLVVSALPGSVVVNAATAADQEAAQSVEALIDAIEVPITPDSEASIQAADKAYNALTDDQKLLVTNAATLTMYKRTLQYLLSEAAIQAVKDLLVAMPADADIDGADFEANSAKVLEAKAAYDALTGQQQASISDLLFFALIQKLDIVAAGGYTAWLASQPEEPDADAVAAADVDEMIDALGEITSLEQSDEVAAVRQAYEDLSDDAKALVTKLDVLIAAEAMIEYLQNPDSLAASGSCGNNVTWAFDQITGTLTLSGTGGTKYFKADSSPFAGKSQIKKVVVQEGITLLGNYLFVNCTGLEEIVLPESLTSIMNYVFLGCTSLTEVTIGQSVTAVGGHAFGFVQEDEYTYTPIDGVTVIGYTGSEAEQYAYTNDLAFKSIAEAAPSTGAVTGKCGDTVSFHLSEGTGLLELTGSGVMADWLFPEYSKFYRNIFVKTVVMENGITDIANYAFYQCKNLSAITIPESVTEIGYGAFEGCENLTIFGKVGSYAESYAKENGIPFEAYTGTPEPDVPAENELPLLDGDVTDRVVSDSVTTTQTPIDGTKAQWLFSRDKQTKLRMDSAAPLTVQWHMSEATAVQSYALTSAYDTLSHYNEFPLGWVFYGSNDGETWDELDARMWHYYDRNHETKVYAFDNSTAYTQYKLVINTCAMLQVQLGCMQLSTESLAELDADKLVAEEAAAFDAKLQALGTVTPNMVNEQLIAQVKALRGEYNSMERLVLEQVKCLYILQEAEAVINGAAEGKPAGTEFTEGDLKYKVLEDGTLEVITWSIQKAEMSVPAVVQGKTVTRIGMMAFCGSDIIQEVRLPETVKAFGDYVFSGTVTLQNIYMDENNPYFKDVDGVLFSKDGTELVFCPAGRTAYSVPDGVVKIAATAFVGCEMPTFVEIPASVTEIELPNFASCVHLENIFVDEENPNYYDVDGVLYGREENAVLVAPWNKVEHTIADGVTKIAADSFTHTYDLEKVIIPASVVEIAENAFEHCSKLTIYGYAGSAAEVYAAAHEFDFVALALPYDPGDMDMNNTVDVADIMKLKALIMADQWSEDELAIGDLDTSGRLDVGDIMSVKNTIMAA